MVSRHWRIGQRTEAGIFRSPDDWPAPAAIPCAPSEPRGARLRQQDSTITQSRLSGAPAMPTALLAHFTWIQNGGHANTSRRWVQDGRLGAPFCPLPLKERQASN